MITRPLLAVDIEDLKDVKLPVYVSYKLDGIRCLKVDGEILSRSFKPIPNDHIRNYLKKYAVDGMDGEIVTYTDGKLDDFNVTQSKVMREEGEPEFKYFAFDYVKDSLDTPFEDRIQDLYKVQLSDSIEQLEQKLLTTLAAVKKFEKDAVAKGYEGVMFRSVKGKYKCGRSGYKEAILLKYKRFVDSEAVILAIEEQVKNNNKKEKNELGLSKRSHKKEGKVLANTMGQFKVQDLYSGAEFYIGTGQGLTKVLRQEIWDNKDKYVNKIIKYKYQDCGKKDLPRFPSFLGFRDPRDMS